MFEKLIEAARTCHESGNPIDECCIEGCPNFDSQPYCLDQILKDCVEALTQSSAELKDKDYLIQLQADEIELLRRDVKKQQEKMIKLAKRLPHWVSVEERLPNVDEKVLVFAIGKLDGFIGDTVIALTSMSDTNWLNHHEKVDKPYWLDPWQYFLTDYRITHWMPLPEPPQEVQDETEIQG